MHVAHSIRLGRKSETDIEWTNFLKDMQAFERPKRSSRSMSALFPYLPKLLHSITCNVTVHSSILFFSHFTRVSGVSTKFNLKIASEGDFDSLTGNYATRLFDQIREQLKGSEIRIAAWIGRGFQWAPLCLGCFLAFNFRFQKRLAVDLRFLYNNFLPKVWSWFFQFNYFIHPGKWDSQYSIISQLLFV